MAKRTACAQLPPAARIASQAPCRHSPPPRRTACRARPRCAARSPGCRPAGRRRRSRPGSAHRRCPAPCGTAPARGGTRNARRGSAPRLRAAGKAQQQRRPPRHQGRQRRHLAGLEQQPEPAVEPVDPVGERALRSRCRRTAPAGADRAAAWRNTRRCAAAPAISDDGYASDTQAGEQQAPRTATHASAERRRRCAARRRRGQECGLDRGDVAVTPLSAAGAAAASCCSMSMKTWKSCVLHRHPALAAAHVELW